MGTDGPWPPSWGSAVPHFGAMDPQILFLNRIFRHFDSNYGNGWAVAPLVGVRGPPRVCYGPPNLVPLSNNSTFRFQLWERMDRGPRGGPRPPHRGSMAPRGSRWYQRKSSPIHSIICRFNFFCCIIVGKNIVFFYFFFKCVERNPPLLTDRPIAEKPSAAAAVASSSSTANER